MRQLTLIGIGHGVHPPLGGGLRYPASSTLMGSCV